MPTKVLQKDIIVYISENLPCSIALTLLFVILIASSRVTNDVYEEEDYHEIVKVCLLKQKMEKISRLFCLKQIT